MADEQTTGIEERTTRLTDALEAVERQLAGIVRAIRSNRVRSSIIAATVAFDLILSIGLGFVVQRVERNSSAIETICESGNVQSKKQHTLWNGLIELTSEPRPGDPPLTQEQIEFGERREASFRVLLDETFPQEECPDPARSTWLLVAFGAIAVMLATVTGWLLYRHQRREDQSEIPAPLAADENDEAEDRRHALEDRLDDAAEQVRHVRDD